MEEQNFAYYDDIRDEFDFFQSNNKTMEVENDQTNQTLQTKQNDQLSNQYFFTPQNNNNKYFFEQENILEQNEGHFKLESLLKDSKDNFGYPQHTKQAEFKLSQDFEQDIQNGYKCFDNEGIDFFDEEYEKGQPLRKSSFQFEGKQSNYNQMIEINQNNKVNMNQNKQSQPKLFSSDGCYSQFEEDLFKGSGNIIQDMENEDDNNNLIEQACFNEQKQINQNNNNIENNNNNDQNEKNTCNSPNQAKNQDQTSEQQNIGESCERVKDLILKTDFVKNHLQPSQNEQKQLAKNFNQTLKQKLMSFLQSQQNFKDINIELPDPLYFTGSQNIGVLRQNLFENIQKNQMDKQVLNSIEKMLGENYLNNFDICPKQINLDINENLFNFETPIEQQLQMLLQITEQNPYYLNSCFRISREQRQEKVQNYLQKRRKQKNQKYTPSEAKKKTTDERLRYKGRFVTRFQAVEILKLKTLKNYNFQQIQHMLNIKTAEKRNKQQNSKKSNNEMSISQSIKSNSQTSNTDVQKSLSQLNEESYQDHTQSYPIYDDSNEQEQFDTVSENTEKVNNQFKKQQFDIQNKLIQIGNQQKESSLVGYSYLFKN